MTAPTPPDTFQALISRLQAYWEKQGCVVLQPYDLPVGAATFHPATFIRALGPRPWRGVYVQPCRRPSDGRYGENPNRLQHYYQLQVILKPSPDDIQALYLGSLAALGLPLDKHDVRFMEDNWESPTLAAWGLGWEIWLDGMEISQFTYFQQVGGQPCKPVTGEITYGLERLAMFLQDKDNVFDLVWGRGKAGPTLYRDIFHRNEVEQSAYNLDRADTDMLLKRFDEHENESAALLKNDLLLPAYEQALLASHAFNVLDSRRAFSVTERRRFILRVRSLAQKVAKAHCKREEGDDAQAQE